MKVISKKEAASLGLRKHYTGVPCKRGHLSERFIGNGGCCQCKYENEKANPDRKKAHDKKYRESHKESIRKMQKEWVKNNSDKNAATKRRYAEKHPERVKESAERSHQKHKEKRLAYSKDWAEKNPKKRKEYHERYKENNREQYLKSKRDCQNKWRMNNPEEAKHRGRIHYKNNSEAIKDKAREYYQENKESVKEYQKQYSLENKDKINARHRKRYESDNDYKVAMIIRGVLNKQIQRSSQVKTDKTHNLLGYSNEKLKQRIEFQFKGGMSWDNYGEWHIDHKKPIARFIRQGVTDPRIINSLSNLQPLWAKDNLEKSDKWIYG